MTDDLSLGRSIPSRNLVFSTSAPYSSHSYALQLPVLDAAKPQVQYGERERPELRSGYLFIKAQVAHAPRTTPLQIQFTAKACRTQANSIRRVPASRADSLRGEYSTWHAI
jgi:hypothetical protein